MDEQETRTLRSFVEEAGRGLRGMNSNAWRDRIERRYRELDAAFDELLDHGQTSEALAMACTLAEFLRISYLQVIIMAAIPAVLYFLSIGLMIEADTRRTAVLASRCPS